MPNAVDLTTLSDDLPVFLQSGIGVGYSAIDVRRAVGVGLQEGVVAAGDFKVTQRAAGAGMAVDVAAGEATIKGDTVVNEGMYYARRGSALTGATEITADAAEANPRVDQVILEIKNDVHDGSGLNRGRVRYLKGTATAGATLDNRTGAAALPNTAIRLADVLMPIGAVNVPTANIRDRRPWARGVYWRHERSANGIGGADYTTGSTTFTALDNTNLLPRLECSGVPLRITFRARLENSGAGFWAAVQPSLDSAAIGIGDTFISYAAAANTGIGSAFSWDVLPSVGSHLLSMMFKAVGGGTAKVQANGSNFVEMTVEEIVRQNASNT